MNIFSARERDLAFVKRWGITRNIREQNVAEHSYFVALWTKRMCEFLGFDPQVTLAAVGYALLHDIREVFSGDQPSPYKKSLGEFAEVHDFDHMLSYKPEDHGLYGATWTDVLVICKLCDLAEAAAKIVEEQSMGNKTLRGCYEEINGKFQNALNELQACDADQRDEIRAMYVEFIQECIDYQSGISTPKPSELGFIEDNEVPF